MPCTYPKASLVWDDITDSLVDYATLERFLQNHEKGLYWLFALHPRFRRRFTKPVPPVWKYGRPPPTPLPCPKGSCTEAPAAHAAARAAPSAGIFDGVHSIPIFWISLHASAPSRFSKTSTRQEGLLQPTPSPRENASNDFGDSLKTILALAERYPAQSLPLCILTVFVHFPARRMVCSRRRGKPRHISTAASPVTSAVMLYVSHRRVGIHVEADHTAQ